jgi:hypothetical protein
VGQSPGEPPALVTWKPTVEPVVSLATVQKSGLAGDVTSVAGSITVSLKTTRTTVLPGRSGGGLVLTHGPEG